MDDVIADFRLAHPIAQHEQIAAYLRQQIQLGALPVGARLPATQELARAWGVTVTVIQAALAPLVQEGLLLRRPRVGTVVRRRSAELGCVGLYRIAEPAREGTDHFSRRLAAVTEAQLASRGIAAESFTDLRPEEERRQPCPQLLQAIRTGRVEAVIACESETRANPWLVELPVSSVIYGAPFLPNSVGHDLGQFGRDAVACLAARGCRSVGLVSVFPATDDDATNATQDLHRGFLDAAAASGLVTRPPWICTPARGVFLPEAGAEQFGYDAMLEMWSRPERPDGLVVFTDLVARGVIMGLLARAGEDRPLPRLVLHRNVELGLFCPLDADYLDVSLAALAETLIDRLERQRQGERLSWTEIPYAVSASGVAQ